MQTSGDSLPHGGFGLGPKVLFLSALTLLLVFALGFSVLVRREADRQREALDSLVRHHTDLVSDRFVSAYRESVRSRRFVERLVAQLARSGSGIAMVEVYDRHGALVAASRSTSDALAEYGTGDPHVREEHPASAMLAIKTDEAMTIVHSKTGLSEIFTPVHDAGGSVVGVVAVGVLTRGSDHAGQRATEVLSTLQLAVGESFSRYAADHERLRVLAEGFASGAREWVRSIRVLSRDLRVVAGSARDSAIHAPANWRELAQRTLSAGVDLIASGVPPDGGVVFHYRPIMIDDGQPEAVGVIEYALDVGAVDERIAEFRTGMAVGGAAIVAVALLVLWMVLGRVVTGPVLRFVEHTGRVAAGDLAVRADESRSDELGLLARSFNAMAREVEQARTRLVDDARYIEEVIEGMGEALLVFSPDGVVKRANAAAARMLGVGPGDLAGCMAGDVLAPGLWERLGVCRSGARLNNIEGEALAARGRRVPVLCSASAIAGPGGGDVVVLALDVSERKLAEAALENYTTRLEQYAAELVASSGRLRESEDRFRQAFHTSPDAISISALANGRFVEVNREFEALTGYAVADVVGRRCPAEVNIWVVEAERERFARELKARGELKGFSAKLKTRAGREVDVLLSASLIMINSEPHALSICRDMTGFNRAQSDLRHERDFVSAILNSAGALVLVLDSGGRIVRFNRACERTGGHAADEVMGKPVWDVFASRKDAPAMEAAFGSGADVPREYEGAWVVRDGSRRTISWQNALLADADGRTEFVVCVGVDVTARREAEAERRRLTDELVEKNRELEQIVYVMSHDLRSPLVNIHGFAREIEAQRARLALLLASPGLPADLRAGALEILERETPDALQYIESSHDRMDAMLTGLLRLSRFGRVPIETRAVDMSMLVAFIVETFEFRIKEQGVVVEVSPDMPLCLGDETQLGHVFSNLLDNALKYLDPARPGRIRIRGGIDAGRAVYAVEDNGIGIAPERLPSVFDLFYRAAEAHGPGEGLGLSIVQRSMARQGGRVWAESEPGRGSTFHISLPLA
jgi:PAS domain S-box-containing protein